MMKRSLRLLALLACACVALPTAPAQVTVRNGMSLANTSGSIAYSAGSTYAKGDVVTSGGVAYVSLAGANTGNTPASSPSQWQQVGPSGGASVLPVANGGTGTGSTLTGLVRGSGSAMTAAELSGDVTTSGSNAATVASVAGTAAATIKTRSFGTTFGDTAGSALTSGSVVYMTVPYACTVAAWNMTVDAGTATIDIWKIASGTAIPTATNAITASALPAISTGTAKHSTTLTGWTTAVAANDVVAFQLNSVATAKYVEIDIQCNQ